MNKNRYVIFFKTKKDDYRQAKRLDLPLEQWENYCKENYTEYEIKDLSQYTPDELHLLTNITKYNDNYYLPEEQIPYPLNEASYIKRFDKISLAWDKEHACTEKDYDDVYNGDLLYTCITTELEIDNNKYTTYINAQCFVHYFLEFLEKLEDNNHAVYTNENFSPTKLLAWVKDDKIRLVSQSYNSENVSTEFDVLVDKDYFVHLGHSMIHSMQDRINADIKRYKKYAMEKYGKLVSDSVSSPNVEQFEIKDIKTIIDYKIIYNAI